MAETIPPSQQTREYLFPEFTDATYADWYQAAILSLKGKAFDKLIKHSYEEIDIKPLYNQQDIEDLSFPHTLPGEYPFVRGTKSEGYKNQAWLIAQESNVSNLDALNQALKHDLAQGQTAINISAEQCKTLEDIAKAFADIDITQYPLLVQADGNAWDFTGLLLEHLQNQGAGTIRGCIGYDPLHQLAKHGDVSRKTFDSMADYTRWATESAPQLDTIAVHTDAYHDAGATAVQELAIALATGVTYICELLDRGLDIDSIAGKIHFFVNIGGNFFMEIAKFRAARLLWAQIIREFGGGDESAKMKLHARTGWINKTIYDTHVNMLRVTTEAMAGAIGGIDSMSVSPFDETYREPDDFSRRIARNVQLILQEEVNLVNLIDPAGGSWYIESLTDQLAQSTWGFFQEIEKQGGILSALKSGWLNDLLHDTLIERIQNLHFRKDILVGTNMYAYPTDTAPTQVFLRLRNTLETESKIDKDDLIIAPRFTEFRIAEPIEALRSIASTYKNKHGHPPQIFLANIGELSQYKARMDFTVGFYEVGGFELLNHGGYDSVETAIQATIESNAPAVVICSTDEVYVAAVPQFASQVKAQKPDMLIILAGYPNDKIEDYRSAGVDDFIHIRANCYEKNLELREKLGVGK